ncbi:hypothetical protein CVT25_006771 [Psilocybe cyanescens]|uniref:Uncharacterized protein n=1 Tax=Psilocybe cyanescens TaxID=93625 RepID=A0A409X7F4_PSICY|nr:hypothetical protein CVT25_006771 [Psilocybe cyanescens]
MAGWWSSFLDIFPWFRKDPSFKLFNRATEAFKQYKSTENLEDLDTALSNFHLALASRRKTRDDRAHFSLEDILTRYADALWKRYNKDKSAANLDKVIKLDEEVCSIWEQRDETTRPTGYPAKLLDLGSAYFIKYGEARSSAGLFAKVIEKYDKLLNGKLQISGDIRRMGLMKYGVALTTWCDKQEEDRMTPQTKQRLDAGISYMEQALNMKMEERTDSAEQNDAARMIRQQCLFNLAIAHYKRYNDDNSIAELDKAIGYNQKMLGLISNDHADFVYCKFDLAQQLFHKYNHERSLPDTQNLLDTQPRESRDLGRLVKVKKYANDLLEQIKGRAEYSGMETDLMNFLDTVEQHHSRSVSRQSSREGSVARAAGSGSSNGSHT